MKIFQRKQGFTLVETLVAISVLVLAISGAFAAAQSGLSSYQHSKNQTIAINLAQEAMEMVRAYRDSNSLSGVYWLTGIASNSSDPCYINETCILSITNSGENATCTGACPVLNQDPVTGYYGYASGWTGTVFRREIEIRPVNPSGCTNNCTEVSVLVTVTWSKGVSTKQYKTRVYLFDW